MSRQDANSGVERECDISFFVPCLNEQGNVGPTLQNIIQVGKELNLDFEILVFDDCSTDGTAGEVEQSIRENPGARIRLVRNKIKRGLARNYVEGAYVGIGHYYMLVNGDNAEPPESIQKMLLAKGKADIVIPVFQGNDHRTFGRRTLSRAFTALVNWISGFHIGYYNGPALHRRFNVMRWHADTDGFAYQAEIITRLVQEGATYQEVIIRNNDRVLGTSSALTMRNFLAIAHSLLQIFIRRIRFEFYYRNKGKPQLHQESKVMRNP